MLCSIHKNQEHIAEPVQQFARHLDLGSFLLEKQEYAEAEENLRCAFTLYEQGLVSDEASVVMCFSRLLQALDAQKKEDLCQLYLKKGEHLNFKSILSKAPPLRVVEPVAEED